VNTFEAEVVEGLEEFGKIELRRDLPRSATISQVVRGAVQFEFEGGLEALFHLRTVQAVYQRLIFPVPRPKALLGDQHFRKLKQTIEQIIINHPRGDFRTLGIAAAGSDSSVMQRLRKELAKATALDEADDRGDLLIRIRPTQTHDGWECLVRVTPRPHATRSWRVQNYEAALNGTVAFCMALLTQPRDNDRFLNLCCGSGSLLIERLFAARGNLFLGIDRDTQTLTLAGQNIQAAKLPMRASQLVRGDVCKLPVASASITSLVADAPFGQRSGSHAENVALYPRMFAEAARVAVRGARFVLITHEIRLIEQWLAKQSDWVQERSIKITLRGLHPRIFVLTRL
jgi:23S rRNA G2445 N2-methylase RlmL